MQLGDTADALRELARNSRDCVKLIDLDGRIRGWNTACEQQYGWLATDVLGRELPQVPSDMRRRSIADIRGVAARGEVARREMEVQRADGTRFFADVVLIPVTDSDGDPSGVISIVRDSAADQRADLRRGSFAAVLAEYLREPLSNLLLSAQLMARDEVMRDERRRAEISTQLSRSAGNALRFVEDLMMLSELETGELVLEKEPALVGNLISEAMGTVEGATGRVIADFDPMLSAVVVDSRRIVAALVILIDMALHVTPAHASVTVSAYQSRSRAVIEVRDRGPALSSGDAAALLSRYYTGADPRGQAGSAMGMYVVRGIVDAHAGDVAIASAERGPGSVVRVRLPL
jgi:PAS domain S-box-containing protein